jgi:hypothetical protein
LVRRPQEESEVVVEQQPRRAPKLRYLDFVQVAAAQAVVCLAGLYGLAKDHAGPLRPGVDAVESTVKGVAGPVYARFGGLPLDVLAFVDRKVSRVARSPSSPAPSLVWVADKHDLGAVVLRNAWGPVSRTSPAAGPLPPVASWRGSAPIWIVLVAD